ncbi:hypothetical protein [Brachybacterium sp. FME24]|uniref:hypothetical protein n=1 Tax=Brachybacterium sp. FME24 TaxID=2742605 RepID=UPI001868A124|nr:hypothetical protein [Brachybacterium sp. FME24]
MKVTSTTVQLAEAHAFPEVDASLDTLERAGVRQVGTLAAQDLLRAPHASPHPTARAATVGHRQHRGRIHW